MPSGWCNRLPAVLRWAVCIDGDCDSRADECLSATRTGQRALAGVGRLAYFDILGSSDLERLRRLFQKRHLLAHSDGIVDQRYVNESGDSTFKVGQRITVSMSEVDDIVIVIGKFVAGLRNAVNGPPVKP